MASFPKTKTDGSMGSQDIRSQWQRQGLSDALKNGY
jgi:hypothetical protein